MPIRVAAWPDFAEQLQGSVEVSPGQREPPSCQRDEQLEVDPTRPALAIEGERLGGSVQIVELEERQGQRRPCRWHVRLPTGIGCADGGLGVRHRVGQTSREEEGPRPTVRVDSYLAVGAGTPGGLDGAGEQVDLRLQLVGREQSTGGDLHRLPLGDELVEADFAQRAADDRVHVVGAGGDRGVPVERGPDREATMHGPRALLREDTVDDRLGFADPVHAHPGGRDEASLQLVMQRSIGILEVVPVRPKLPDALLECLAGRLPLGGRHERMSQLEQQLSPLPPIGDVVQHHAKPLDRSGRGDERLGASKGDEQIHALTAGRRFLQGPCEKTDRDPRLSPQDRLVGCPAE